jgi:hypothetical protein
METIITLTEHNGVRSITKSSVKPASLEGYYETWEHKNGTGKSFRFVMSSDNPKQKTMSFAKAVKMFNGEKESEPSA